MQNQSHDRLLRSTRREFNPARCPDAYAEGSEVTTCLRSSENADVRLFREIAAQNIARLSVLQNQVLDLLLAGYPSKHISAELKISQSSVACVREAIARRLGAHSFAEIVHSAICGRCTIGAPETGEIVLSGVDVASAELSPEELVRFDMREVSHRLKNFAAIIQSICHQTARGTTSVVAFDKIFSARLSAFCSSLDALVAGDWSNMSMRKLIEMQLSPFGLLDCDQISASGPDLDLKPAAAHAVGMALHELATNAVKYGSLSIAEGRVTIAWRMETLAETEDVVLSWQESNGPTVVEPTHKSFGLQIIQKLTALSLHGTVRHQFLPEGVFWQLRFDSKLLTSSPSQIEEARHEHRC